MDRPRLTRNPTSLAGAGLTTLSAAAFLIFLVLEAFGVLISPYSGLIGYLLIPAFFVLGLLLIPLGMWRERRRRTQGAAPWAWPTLDFNRPRTRVITTAIVLLTIVNVSLIALASVGVVHYTESNEFCGQVCHAPMAPEFSAHQVGAHARVDCVQCHVAPGAKGFVAAKTNGTRQLYLFMRGTYSKPIPEPHDRLPAVTGTCAECHTPGRPPRDVVRRVAAYNDDETSSDNSSELTMLMAANHWHARADVNVEYVATDAARETIPYVRVTAPGGAVTEYFADGVTERPAGVTKRMDCLDCHNRPAHTFAATADRAVDGAIASGALPTSLPYTRRDVMAALKKDYDTADAGASGIRGDLMAAFAAAGAGRQDEIDRTIAAATRVYRENVFPSMKITWGTYPNQMGHSDTLGCFRCHDDSHKSKSGTLIRQDCELCHSIK